MPIKLNQIMSAVFMPICALAALVSPVGAQTSTQTTPAVAPYVAPADAPEPNDISSATSADSKTSVFIGGTPIMRVRYALGGYTTEQRASAIQQRVNRILGQGPIVPADVTIQDIDNTDTAVYVKGQLLFTADISTAQYNQTSVHDLAAKWAATMRRVLPGLTQPS